MVRLGVAEALPAERMAATASILVSAAGLSHPKAKGLAALAFQQSWQNLGAYS
jgi:hypothetical protein